MLYLIGGPGRTGKTSLAIRLVATTPMPMISTDVLQSAFGKSAPGLKIGHGPPGEIQAQNFRPHLMALGQALSSSRFAANAVIEGHVLRPAFADELCETIEQPLHHGADVHRDDHLRVCFLGWSSLSIDLLLSHEGENLWFSDLPQYQREAAVESILKESSEQRAECKQHQIQFFDMADGDYFDQHTRALHYLLGL